MEQLTGSGHSRHHEAIIRTKGKQLSQRQQQGPEPLSSRSSSPQGLRQLGREDPRLQGLPEVPRPRAVAVAAASCSSGG